MSMAFPRQFFFAISPPFFGSFTFNISLRFRQPQRTLHVHSYLGGDHGEIHTYTTFIDIGIELDF